MKAKPVRRYRTPRYPTKLMIVRNPELLQKSMKTLGLPHKQLAGALLIYFAATGGSSCDWGPTTGCVVVVPPAYMSEEEALQVIKDELSTYGVNLSDDSADLEAVVLPVEEDAVDREKNIAVEFISRSDCVELGGGDEEDMFCDFYSARSTLREQVEAGETDINFGIFLDPQIEDLEYSKELLRDQVRDFADWLEDQGVI